jgi:putative ABC transport system permease protein
MSEHSTGEYLNRKQGDTANQYSEFILVAKTYVAEYFRKPLLNLGFIFSLAIATSTLLCILILNDASKQQYQAANSRLKSPIAFNIVPEKDKTISITDFTKLRELGFSQVNAAHVFRQSLANGKKISFRALDILPFVLTAPESFTSDAINISQVYANKLGIVTLPNKKFQQLLADQQSIAVNINQVNDWGQVALIDITLAWQLFPDIKGFSHLMVGQMSDSEVVRLEAALPDHLAIQEAWSMEEREGFADALHLNLSALAILGFIVSLFIAFQAANQAWAKRGELAAQLRLLGIKLSTIQKVMLCESLVLTLLASVLGVLIAVVLVSLLLPMLGLTLEQLYRLQVSGHFQWRGEYSLWAFLISFIAVVAALIKQFQRISSSKVAFTARVQNKPFNFKATGIIALALLLVHFFWPDDSWTQLMLKYGVLLIASVAILPNVLRYLLSLLTFFTRSFRLRFIFKDARQQVGRRFLPIAAFYLALTASIAAALMVNSFQNSFESYLNQLLSADLFVRFNDEQKPTVAQWLDKQADVEEFVLFESTVAKYQGGSLQNSQQDTVEVYRLASSKQLQSLILKSGSFASFFVDKSVANKTKADKDIAIKHCYINEQLAYKRSIKLQQIIDITQGLQSLTCHVQGVFYDYGNQGFAIKIPASKSITALSGWQETGFGVFLVESSPAKSSKMHHSQVKKAKIVKAKLIDELGLDESQIYQPEQIKALALAIFKQTFLLTQAIAFVLLSIACFGLFLSANSLELARKSDLHILSSLGYSRVELFGHMLSQWFILALGTILLSWPVAIVLANALVSLILPASFGWSMPLVLEVTSFAVSSLIGLVILIPALAIPLYKLNIRASLS